MNKILKTMFIIFMITVSYFFHPTKSQAIIREPTLGGKGKPDWYPSDLLHELFFSLPQIQEEVDTNISCIDTYKKFFKENIIYIDIFFGYINHENEWVFDKFQKLRVIDHLTYKCVENYFACGFKKSEIIIEEENIFYHKNILGPDGNRKKIIISLHHSSVSDNDRWNRGRGIYSGIQQQKSKEMLYKFEQSLESSHVVLYKGHSRAGIGPGFFPLPSLGVDYINQVIIKKSKRILKQKLKKNNGRLKLFGYLSCNSKKYYHQLLQSGSNLMGTILTNDETTTKESSQALIATINSLIGMKCSDEFSYVLNIFRRQRFDDYPHSLNNFEISNFFQGN